MLKQHKDEKETLKGIIGYDNAEIVMCGWIDIDEELYQEARFKLFEMHKDEEAKERSRQTIRELRESIRRGELDDIPAVALNVLNHFNRLNIADGHHRIISFYEEKIKDHPAILVMK